jgi:hypothetical protein
LKGYGSCGEAPKEMAEEKIDLVACGWDSSAAIVDKNIYMWGNLEDIIDPGQLDDRGRIAMFKGEENSIFFVLFRFFFFSFPKRS